MSKRQEIDRATYRLEPLEEILKQLQEYGKPGVTMLDTGWHCVVHMNTTIAGSEFKIRSDFGHASPLAAAIECCDRVREAVASHNRSLMQ